jgi:hypothetical protein
MHLIEVIGGFALVVICGFSLTFILRTAVNMRRNLNEMGIPFEWAQLSPGFFVAPGLHLAGILGGLLLLWWSGHG